MGHSSKLLLNIFILLLSHLVSAVEFEAPSLSLNPEEVEISFSHFVEFTFYGSGNPNDDEVQTAIDQQLMYLFGSLAGNRPHPSVPRHKQTVTVKSVSIKSISNSVSTQDESFSMATAHYDYSGLIRMVHSASEIDVHLPTYPEGIYDKTLTEQGFDENCFSEKEYVYYDQWFWYFWNPHNSACILKEGSDFEKVTAKVRKIAPSSIGVDRANLNGLIRRQPDQTESVEIYALFSLTDSAKGSGEFSTDDSNENFRKLNNYLWLHPSNRFELEMSESDLNYQYKIFKKKIEFRGRPLTIRIHSFFGWGSPYVLETSTKFYGLVQEALSKGSLFIYSGHSEFGKTFDNDILAKAFGLPYIGDNLFHSDLYQIYYLVSCNSYTHYLNQFADSKKRNVDIITTGIESKASTSGSNVQILIQSLLSGLTSGVDPSWQNVIKEINTNSDSMTGIHTQR